jgi:hypothetical protein
MTSSACLRFNPEGEGGILVAWRTDSLVVSLYNALGFSISAKFLPHGGGDDSWWLTTVYGPANDSQKPLFLQELNKLRRARVGLSWLVCGDFNMIYQVAYKNNGQLNRRPMGQFCCFLSEGSLGEIHLQGRLFTWSNERAHPTLERIDRAFISNEWDALHPDCDLHLPSSSCSDHAMLILWTNTTFFTRKQFHFRSFWPKSPGFMQVIERAWHCLMHNADMFSRLAWLLHNTTRCMQSWSAKTIENIRVQLSLASEIVLRPEIARDRRPLALPMKNHSNNS